MIMNYIYCQQKIHYRISPHLATHGEASAAIGFAPFIHQVAPSHRHIIQDPVMLIVEGHPHFQQIQLLHIFWPRSFVLFGAYFLAVYIL